MPTAGLGNIKVLKKKKERERDREREKERKKEMKEGRKEGREGEKERVAYKHIEKTKNKLTIVSV